VDGAARRPDPVGILEKQDETRVPELVPIRHGRMIVSPFYRGGAAIMAWDLCLHRRRGCACSAVGMRTSNFGLFAAPDRRLVFDLNDFDETLPAPLSGTSSAWTRASRLRPVTMAVAARNSVRRRARRPRPTGRRWPRRRRCASWRSGTRAPTSTSWEPSWAPARTRPRASPSMEVGVVEAQHDVRSPYADFSFVSLGTSIGGWAARGGA
jgi:hypothetical protein